VKERKQQQQRIRGNRALERKKIRRAITADSETKNLYQGGEGGLHFELGLRTLGGGRKEKRKCTPNYSAVKEEDQSTARRGECRKKKQTRRWKGGLKRRLNFSASLERKLDKKKKK